MGKFKISLPEKTVQICLDANLQAEWEAAERALTDARKSVAGDARMVGEGGVLTEAAQKVRDLEEQMAASTLTVRLRALRRADWVGLLSGHPPTEEQADRAFGANRETFFAAAIPASIVGAEQHGEPVDFDVDEDWPDLADGMTDFQYNKFAQAVLELNRSDVSVPFSVAASRTIRQSPKLSERPAL